MVHHARVRLKHDDTAPCWCPPGGGARCRPPMATQLCLSLAGARERRLSPPLFWVGRVPCTLVRNEDEQVAPDIQGAPCPVCLRAAWRGRAEAAVRARHVLRVFRVSRGARQRRLPPVPGAAAARWRRRRRRRARCGWISTRWSSRWRTWRRSTCWRRWTASRS